MDGDFQRETIVLFGDSITKRNVEYAFKGRGRVQSRACPGFTTKEAVAPQEEEFFKPCEKAHVVLFFGGNDAVLPVDQLPEKQAELLKSWKTDITYVTVDEYKANLKTLVEQIRGIYPNPTVYLVTPPAPHEERRLRAMQALERKYTDQWELITASDRTLENTSRYAEAAKSVAQEVGATVVDIFTPMAEDAEKYSSDGLHPSKEGNQLIGDLILAAINKSLGFDDIDEEDGWTAV